MEHHPHGSTAMRILLRKQPGEQYLQPTGEWGHSRETARTFPTSVFAYHWAKEKELLGVEVLLAFEDSRWDVVTMRV